MIGILGKGTCQYILSGFEKSTDWESDRSCSYLDPSWFFLVFLDLWPSAS